MTRPATLPARLSGPDFAARLESYGPTVAVVTSTGERVTYGDLALRADAFAQQLPADAKLLALEARNDLESVVAYLGALRAGRPLILTAADANHARIYETFQPDARVVSTGDCCDILLGERRGTAAHEDLALLLTTSGTTGAAKLVRLSASALNANALAIADYLQITSDDRAITSLPISYSYGLSVINSHLAVGASLILTDRSVTQPDFWRLVDVHGATSLAGVPYTYELLERTGFLTRAPGSLRTLTQAGGRMAPGAVRQFAEWALSHRVQFYVMYGQTEATARMAYLPPAQVSSHPDCIGRPIPGGAFELRSPAGEIIEQAGAEGELVYRGPNVMMGYATTRADLNRPSELTELHTGDLAVRDAHGLYRITGRMSRFAKIFGLRLSLDEIEAQLQAIGAGGLAVSDDSVIVLGLPRSTAHLNCAERLSRIYDLPLSVFQETYWDETPKLASGKPDYQAVLRSKRVPAVETPDPGLSPDAMIRTAFARAFPGRALRDADSFIGLGGDSLNYVAVSLDIELALGSLPERWEQLTLAQLTDLPARFRATSWWSLRWIESEIILRAVAVICVVIVHASAWPVGGGAEVLLLLAGYSLARYQKTRLLSGRGFEVVRSFFSRIIVPYYALLVVYGLAKRQFDLPSFLLISNFQGRFRSLLEPFWFLEALLQCFAIVCGLFALKPVRVAVARHPWTMSLTFLGAALALKVLAHASFHDPALGNRTPPVILYLFALGWCVHEAGRSASRRWLLAGVLGAIGVLMIAGRPGVWLPEASPISHLVWLAACGVGLLWVRRAPLPAFLHGIFAAVASASFYIYLTHVGPVHVLHWMHDIGSTSTVVGASVALGIVTWWLASEAPRLLRAKAASRRQVRG